VFRSLAIEDTCLLVRDRGLTDELGFHLARWQDAQKMNGRSLGRQHLFPSRQNLVEMRVDFGLDVPSSHRQPGHLALQDVIGNAYTNDFLAMGNQREVIILIKSRQNSLMGLSTYQLESDRKTNRRIRIRHFDSNCVRIPRDACVHCDGQAYLLQSIQFPAITRLRWTPVKVLGKHHTPLTEQRSDEAHSVKFSGINKGKQSCALVAGTLRTFA
jgi:hypothetical protein